MTFFYNVIMKDQAVQSPIHKNVCGKLKWEIFCDTKEEGGGGGSHGDVMMMSLVEKNCE